MANLAHDVSTLSEPCNLPQVRAVSRLPLESVNKEASIIKSNLGDPYVHSRANVIYDRGGSPNR